MKKRLPSRELRSVADDSRARRGEFAVAAEFNADRAGRLQHDAAQAKAQALVDGVIATDGGLAALAAAFPAANDAGAPVLDRDALIAAAAKRAPVMKRIAALAESVGVAQSAVRKRADRARAMIDAVAAAKSQTTLVNAFRDFTDAKTRFEARRVVSEAAARADAMGRLERVAKACGVVIDGKTARKLRTGARRAEAYGAAAVDAVQKRGAKMPTEELAQKRSWRVQVVDTPEGSIAKPAFVVAIEPNAPLGRLSRASGHGDAPALSASHLRAAEEVMKLYFASMKGARLVGSYEGVVVDNAGGARAHPLDTACASWAKLEAAMKTLLKVEERVVMEVCVYETPIEALARRRDLVHFGKQVKAEAAVVQTLRCGLQRLAMHWGLDLGDPQDACK